MSTVIMPNITSPDMVAESNSTMMSYLGVKLNAVKLEQQESPATRAPSSVVRDSSVGSAGTPQSQCLGSPYAGLHASPSHRPKVKGEAMPKLVLEASPVKRQGSTKIFDEAHHFGLCEHYAKLLDQAKEVGFQNVKWPTGFTLFHLAAKKNCAEFVQWLHDHDLGEIHAIDDFGKKPLDYACPHKRDSIYPMIERMMSEVSAPKDAKQEKYEAIKNGTYVPKKKNVEEKSKNMDDIMDDANIAEGDAPPKKNLDLMTVYEAEQMIPSDYKKALKQASNGWQRMKEEGKWPGGVSLLHWAARNGKADLCQFLMVEYGADPHEEDGNGHSAIYHAKLKKHRKLSKSLITKNFRKA